MVEAVLRSQIEARDAWQSVRDDIAAGTGPTSDAAAVRLFRSRFPGDPNVIDQFTSCEGYDPAVNKLSKVAGVSGFGKAKVDPCYCDAFCADVVASTVLHEQTHVPTILAGTMKFADATVACKLGLIKGYTCDTIQPSILADSELLSHQAGVASLQLAMQRIANLPDDENPNVKCTWEPLTRPTTARARTAAPPAAVPEGLLDRLSELGYRLIFGAP